MENTCVTLAFINFSCPYYFHEYLPNTNKNPELFLKDLFFLFKKKKKYDPSQCSASKMCFFKLSSILEIAGCISFSERSNIRTELQLLERALWPKWKGAQTRLELFSSHIFSLSLCQSLFLHKVLNLMKASCSGFWQVCPK